MRKSESAGKKKKKKPPAGRDAFCVQPPGQRGMPPCCALVLIQRRKHSCNPHHKPTDLGGTMWTNPIPKAIHVKAFATFQETHTNIFTESQPLVVNCCPIFFCWRCTPWTPRLIFWGQQSPRPYKRSVHSTLTLKKQPKSINHQTKNACTNPPTPWHNH